MNPKLAHLFLVRDDLHQEVLWHRFFTNQEKQHSIYVHAKWPERITSNWLQSRLISRHCVTEYGRISLVQAEMLLLEAALEDSANQFFLLHSESCVPLRTAELVHTRLCETRESWLFYTRGNMERYNGVNQHGIGREDFHKTSQFFCLTRADAELVLREMDVNDWKQSWCPDEHWIATILAKKCRLQDCIKHDATFSHWPRLAQSPYTFDILSIQDVDRLRATSAFFARKFTKSSDIMQFIPMPFPKPLQPDYPKMDNSIS